MVRQKKNSQKPKIEETVNRPISILIQDKIRQNHMILSFDAFHSLNEMVKGQEK